ncbi:NADH-FMN oxidoreductase RutF, flavin reductase (DIM6/NTAB) family [Tistlia consotensis]|uniref:NADH-FMN oxidoreductase RutF, flavin reductase (DIM6/NTAB) family n=1 Tax=Tistlia consotensis USBA 355 TaxID=560819 RepID=A0A1Y6CBK1_9PROT|nr:flavin reductase family protein [Tistlia consotensis]SMF55524.1 NADH-FMN oxidoreductase RutF, flavin reductase (DIM6/NTAB) family [Tistlia consotensis USBA 355]SNR88591.1 NADH-FMN oxidoreductase RutF, flavin reductase (DIM6/NTAB) family [Tistlia consotensis]
MHFYEPKDGHRLAYDPFKAIVAPRPIGWISTLDAEGRPNLAPYSFFNAMCSRPPMVAFSSEGPKDSPRNAEATGEFVFNLSTLPLARQMNATSAMVEPGVDEFALAGLTAAPCRLVKAPRVAESPAALECRVLQVLRLEDLDGGDTGQIVVLGQVVGVHLDERFLKDGYFDTAAAQALARCGYRDFAAVTEVFALLRPEEAAAAAK